LNARILLKIRDDHPEIIIRRIEAEPAFLRARVTPQDPSRKELGLYRIHVEVPPNSPPGSYFGDNPGKIHIETDHPHLPLLTLAVEFGVVDRRSISAGDMAWKAK